MSSQSSVAEPAEDPTAQLIRDEPWLADHAWSLKNRHERLQERKRQIEASEGSLEKFASGYTYYGFTRDAAAKAWRFREWAPNASNVHLIGEFNGWNRSSHPLVRNQYGVWELVLPDGADGKPAITHETKVKLSVTTGSGACVDRISAWAKRVVQDPHTMAFDDVFWNPPADQLHQWLHQPPPTPAALRIYEAHIGMATSEGKVGSYREFADFVLPWAAGLAYNAVQVMAVMEHPYYASFGYQVSNFFAVSSRFGTPEDLKYLIDKAHSLGLMVLLDLVHSHSAKNILEGLSELDGTNHLYFHASPRGDHPVWDSRLFDYSKWEVQRFLLSNVRWYLDEYRFDGYRFDGVTSMLYLHHGLKPCESFFNHEVDEDALLYLALANEVAHSVKPSAITIAEEVTGMPALCRPTSIGGVGFDYRLHMAVPDMWIRLLKTLKDDDWSMSDLVHTLTNRPHMTKSISYCESHDQALVGDKTISFWLMDKEMYDFMSLFSPLTPIIDRGLALHKLIRLLTSSLGGEGYLNFMGNEFGHPEWIDFPREGNGNSFHHCRRQWNLAVDESLRYKFLKLWDQHMNELERRHLWLQSPQAWVACKDEGDKIITFERAGLLFVFNLHPTQSLADYYVAVDVPGKYELALSSDEVCYGGHGRVSVGACAPYLTLPANPEYRGRAHMMSVYVPCRTAIVLRLVN